MIFEVLIFFKIILTLILIHKRITCLWHSLAIITTAKGRVVIKSLAVAQVCISYFATEIEIRNFHFVIWEIGLSTWIGIIGAYIFNFVNPPVRPKFSLAFPWILELHRDSCLYAIMHWLSGEFVRLLQRWTDSHFWVILHGDFNNLSIATTGV